ncbi:uncharacterized protein JCM6883_003841 [Sporobolomyces salmoneus]|uniref:uncharacterized protein n=1 Tax=Sporobolomyces salmoneus TaxID=183962 RepID=UPI003178DBB6
MNLMERRQASWSKRNAANKAHPTLSQSTFEPPEPLAPTATTQPESTIESDQATSRPQPEKESEPVDEPVNFDILPNFDSSAFQPLPLANTPLAHTPLPQSDSNNSIETTTSHFTDARTDFSSPPLSRSNAVSPLEGQPPAQSTSPPHPHDTPRSVSSSTLEGVSPEPPRRSESFSPPPPLPRKNSARNSLVDSRRSISSDQLNRSRANSAAVQGSLDQAVCKVPSFTTTTSPAPRIPESTSTSISPPPSTDLSQPRPRPPLRSTNSRTPALSQAGSVASSRFSLASENSSGLRNSELFQSPDMTEEGYSHRTSSVVDSEWSSRIKSDSATPYSTDNEEVSTSRPTPELQPPAPTANLPRSDSKPVGLATLQLDTSSMEKHPSPPTGMPPTASLAGLGIGWEEGDLQKNLDELSRYAKTLPSPLPSPLPHQDVESPLDRYLQQQQQQAAASAGSGGGGSRGRGTPSNEAGPALLSPLPTLPSRTITDPSPPATTLPTPPSPTRARSRSASRSRQPTKKTSLVNLAASASSSPYFGSRSGKNRSEPAPPPPLPSTTKRERERSSTQDSESYLSLDDTDFLSTDDEESSRSVSKMRFQSFSQSSDYARLNLNDGDGLRRPSETHSAGTLSPIGLPTFSNLATLRGQSDLGSGLWNSDLGRSGGDDEDVERIVPGIVDWSEKAIEVTEVPSNTTHLILARTLTPLLIAPLLNVTIPNLSHGLVVLDVSSCGLTEVPLALAACTALEELDIHGNPLATGTLPSFLGSLPSLLVLNTDGCGLSFLPSSLSHLTQLHTLAVRNNRLRALPAWFSRLSSLETLLVDGNPLHWQYQNLIRPLLSALSDSPEQVPPPFFERQTASPLPSNSSLTTHSLPPSRARSPSGTLASSIHGSFSIPPSLAESPTVARFPTAPSISSNFPSSAPPQMSSFAELSIPSPTNRDRDEQPLPSPATIVPSPDPSIRAQTPVDVNPNEGGGGVTSKKWGRLFKKVSSSRMNPKRPGALEPETRTYSEPITRAEGSEVEEKSKGLFGSRKAFRKKASRPPVPKALSMLSDPATPNSAKRRSFLVLDAFKPPSEAIASRQLPNPSTPQNHQLALRSVLAYLRDLDDLSEDTSLPNIPLDSPSPPLRHSPSLGALSPSPPRVDSPDVRRAQSTRRPFPSRTSPRPGSSSRLSDYYDESTDSVSPGRGTPLPGGTFSPLPGTSSAAIEQIKMKNDPVRREAVLKEIVETEQTYLRGLEELCAIYVASSAKTVSSNGGKKDPVLPVAERRAVFSNIEAIRDFHRTIFLPDLLAAVRAGGESSIVAGRVGEVFRQHGSFLKIYSAYVNGFDSALAQIQTWAASSTSGRPSTASGPSGGTSSTLFDAASQIGSNLTQSRKKRIKSWMKRCRAHPSHSQISLESYLLLPVQRIPRYRLLLESLLACTPSPPTDSLAPLSAFLSPTPLLSPHPTILSAVLEMDLVATTLNESKRETEGRAQLLMWQGRIVNRYKSSLVQPHRTLLRSGKLVLTRSVKKSTTHLDALPPPLPAASSMNGSRSRSRLGTNNEANGHSSPPLGDEIHTLFTETSTQELIVLLCTDLLILVKAPPAPLDSDPNAPVELYTVVRLNSGVVEGGGQGGQRRGGNAASSEGPVSLFGKDEDMLRIKVGTKAILYLQHPSASNPPSSSLSQSSEEAASAKRKRKMEARQWRDAINLQFYINT